MQFPLAWRRFLSAALLVVPSAALGHPRLE